MGSRYMRRGGRSILPPNVRAVERRPPAPAAPSARCTYALTLPSMSKGKDETGPVQRRAGGAGVKGSSGWGGGMRLGVVRDAGDVREDRFTANSRCIRL